MVAAVVDFSTIARDYPFQPKKFPVAGGTLSYVDTEGSGAPVVCLHGNPTWSFFYRDLIHSLSDDFRCIAPDHMGCGLSDKPQNYRYCLEQHIDNLELLLASIPPPYTLIVHDWGGAIGCGYAVRHPDRIKNLVVMNTAAFRSARIPLRIRLCRLPFIGALVVRGFNGFAGPAVTMAVARTMTPAIRRGFLFPYQSWHDRIAVHRFVQDIPLQPSHPSYRCLQMIEEGLPRLSQKPMLILWGGKDFCFNDHFFEEWQRRFPKAESHYFPSAGHYLLEDSFDEIQPIIGRFLHAHQ